jgi:hypothetical protein
MSVIECDKILLVKSRGESVNNFMRLTRLLMWHTKFKRVLDAKAIVCLSRFVVRITHEPDKLEKSLEECEAEWEIFDVKAITRDYKLTSLGFGDPREMLEIADECELFIGPDIQTHVRALYSIMTDDQLRQVVGMIEWEKT